MIDEPDRRPVAVVQVLNHLWVISVEESRSLAGDVDPAELGELAGDSSEFLQAKMAADLFSVRPMHVFADVATLVADSGRLDLNVLRHWNPVGPPDAPCMQAEERPLSRGDKKLGVEKIVQTAKLEVSSEMDVCLRSRSASLAWSFLSEPVPWISRFRSRMITESDRCNGSGTLI